MFAYRCNLCQFPTEQAFLHTFVLRVVSAQAFGSVENNRPRFPDGGCASVPKRRASSATSSAGRKREHIHEDTPGHSCSGTHAVSRCSSGSGDHSGRAATADRRTSRPSARPALRLDSGISTVEWAQLYLDSRTLCDPPSSRCRLGSGPLCPASRGIRFCCRSLALIKARAIPLLWAPQLAQHRLDLMVDLQLACELPPIQRALGQ